MKKNKSCLSCRKNSLDNIFNFGELPLVNNYYSSEEIEKEEKISIKPFIL